MGLFTRSRMHQERGRSADPSSTNTITATPSDSERIAGPASAAPGPFCASYLRLCNGALLAARSGAGRLVIQEVVLAVAVGAVYLMVLMLGSGLGGSTLQLSGAHWG